MTAAPLAPNGTKLSTKDLHAARLVAEDTLTDVEIAEAVGISKRTLERRKHDLDFIAAVAAQVEAFRNQSLTDGFADKRARLKLLNSMAFDLSDMATKNGYLREEVKLAANGEHVSYEVFDHALVGQVRGVLDDIAKEMGDRKTVAEVTGKDGAPLAVVIAGVDLERV